MWEGNCDSSAIITFELLSTTRFFRGKPTVRCYPPVSVPRVTVQRIPAPDYTSRSVSLVWGY